MSDTTIDNIVEFDPKEFKAMCPDPAFAKLADITFESMFENACLLIDNTPSSPVPYKPRKRILYLATAHFVTLFGVRGADAVGRVASASEGSVSASFEGLGAVSGTKAFWQQTQYGSLYWQATLQWRQMIYVPHPRHKKY